MDTQRFGRIVRALRGRRRWTQSELGARCGMSRSKISRIESGRLEGIPIDDLGRVTQALDARLELDVRWRGAMLDRLLDERHAAIVDATVRWIAAESWAAQVEASFAIRGERGSIDVLARHGNGSLLVIEVKASIGDVNQTLVGLDRKARLAPFVARERGWPSGPVSRLLVVGDTTTSRTRIKRHETAFRAALPAGTAACRAWIRDPTGPSLAGICFIPFPDSRLVNSAQRRASSRTRADAMPRTAS